MPSVNIITIDNGWSINDRYLVYASDGSIYDSHNGDEKDIPKHILQFRDLLMDMRTNDE